MNNELSTNFDLIPDGEDTLIISKLTDLFIERSCRYYERAENLRNHNGKSEAILARKHKMPRSHYEGMARYIWGAAKQSNVKGAHAHETLMAIICGCEVESFLSENLKKKVDAIKINNEIIRKYKSQWWFTVKGKLMLKMSQGEFNKWCNENRMAILKMKHESNYPSLVRVNNLGYYEPSNLRIVPFTTAQIILRAKTVESENVKTGVKQIYSSINQARRSLGISSCGISGVCNGKRSMVKGYRFRFIKNINNT